MKLNKFLLSAIAAASLTACSDNADVVNNNKGQWNADGTGYVSLSISMPDNVGNGTRATNDEFEKGDDNEYAVKNATLVIFSGNGANEGNYTMEAAYALPLKFQTTGTNGQQIISTAKITQKINEIGNAEAKALVILNLPEGLKLDGNDLKYNDVSCIGETFAVFQKHTSNLNVNVTNGFTMTNAPLTTGKSSTTAPSSAPTTTLANITKNNIKPTAEEAAQNPAATIYVERSVAKVTVEDPSAGTIQGTNIKYNIAGYDLDNTNTTSYIVRNADETSSSWFKLRSNSSSVRGDDQYRFIGYRAVDENNKYYRTYWAIDPNYDNITSAINYNPSTEDTRFSTPVGQDHPKYCMENTFDVAHQTQVNTTRAILRVQMYKDGEAPGTTYYMYNNDANTFESKAAFESNALATANKIAAVVASKKTVESISFAETKDATGTYVISEKISGVKFQGEAAETTDVDLLKSIQDYFGEITVYTNGYAYYPVLIKHFGDNLTPWNKEGDTKEWITTQPSANNIYPDDNGSQDNNYLGRYGVVRNNWYNLKVNKVMRPGSPIITPPTDTPDDNIDSYISVSINILSWAKRSQDVDLQ